MTPHVQNIPMAMAGQGAQAVIKIGLALSKTADRVQYVTIEEPESQQSHTSLTQLLSRIEGGAGKEQQLFITTHIAYVLNRLGIDKLTLLSAGKSAKMKDLDPETVAYFRKLPGCDNFITNGVALKENLTGNLYVAVTRAEQSAAIVLEHAGNANLVFWQP